MEIARRMINKILDPSMLMSQIYVTTARHLENGVVVFRNDGHIVIAPSSGPSIILDEELCEWFWIGQNKIAIAVKHNSSLLHIHEYDTISNHLAINVIANTKSDIAAYQSTLPTGTELRSIFWIDYEGIVAAMFIILFFIIVVISVGAVWHRIYSKSKTL